MRDRGVDVEKDSCSRGHPSATVDVVDAVVWECDHNAEVRCLYPNNNSRCWQSMPEYLNFGFKHFGGHDALADNTTKPPKVSLTLSDFLQSEESCDSCDFGWFTPSANSLGSLDDLTPAGAEHGGTFTFSEPDSTAPLWPTAAHVFPGSTSVNTAALSLSSTARNSRDICTSSPSKDATDNNRPTSSTCSSAKTSDSNDPQTCDKSLSAYISCQHNDVTTSSKSAGGSGGSVGISASVGGVRTFIRSRKNRMPEINQWHTLHRAASSQGPLAAEAEGNGKLLLHLRRTAYPLSTRYFPENTTHKAETLVTQDTRESRRCSPNGTPPTALSSHHRSSAPGGSTGTNPYRNPTAAVAAAPACGGALEETAVKHNRGSVRLSGNGSPAVAVPDNSSGRRARDFNKAVAEAVAADRGARGGGGRRLGGSIRDTPSSTQQALRKHNPKSFSWALTEIRVVTGNSPWSPPRAEYLVVACLGQGKLVAGWRRASDFARLAKVARRYWMSKVRSSWDDGCKCPSVLFLHRFCVCWCDKFGAPQIPPVYDFDCYFLSCVFSVHIF